jgi:hypothetical protein
MGAFFRAGTDRQRMFNEQEAAATQAAIQGGRAFAGAVGKVGDQRVAREGIESRERIATRQTEAVEEGLQFNRSKFLAGLAIESDTTPHALKPLLDPDADPILQAEAIRHLNDGKHIKADKDLTAVLKLTERRLKAMLGIDHRLTMAKMSQYEEIMNPLFNSMQLNEAQRRMVLTFHVVRGAQGAMTGVEDYQSKRDKNRLFEETAEEYIKALNLGHQATGAEAETKIATEPLRQRELKARLEVAAQTAEFNLSELDDVLAHTKELDGLQRATIRKNAKIAFVMASALADPKTLKVFTMNKLREMFEGWDMKKLQAVAPILSQIVAQETAGKQAAFRMMQMGLDAANEKVEKQAQAVQFEKDWNDKHPWAHQRREAQDQMSAFRSEQRTYIDKLKQFNPYDYAMRDLFASVRAAVDKKTLQKLFASKGRSSDEIAVRAALEALGQLTGDIESPALEEGLRTQGGPREDQKTDEPAPAPTPQDDKKTSLDLSKVAEEALKRERDGAR